MIPQPWTQMTRFNWISQKTSSSSVTWRCTVRNNTLSCDLFQPAGAIVESAMLSNNITAMPCPSLPKPDNLQRTANRVRQQMRPEQPTDLEFELAMHHIP